jgi:branched-chain amino acid transport system ATP-binding protein
MMNDPVLVVKNVSLSFGGTEALINVSIDHRQNEVLAIIGPNGAGKTSLMNSISGFYKPQKGKIFFKNREVTHMPPRKIARLGLARTFQNLRLFKESTVLNNLMTGAHIHFAASFIEDCIYFGRSRSEDIRRLPIIDEIIDSLDLEKYRNTVVGKLPYGVRKRVELGRALSLEPCLLMLDEPMAGMNKEEKQLMGRYIMETVNARKIPIILIEHDMSVVMNIASRITVLNIGQKIAEGTPEEIKKDPEVIKAYLGDTLMDE